MLLVTEQGHTFTVVEDFDDPTTLWVRSQDRESIEHAAAFVAAFRGFEVPVQDEPTWDYQFRFGADRDEWAAYLEQAVEDLHAHKLKPAVAKARGRDHPVARAVEEVFYYLSYNRPDRSRPSWITGDPKAGRDPEPPEERLIEPDGWCPQRHRHHAGCYK